MSSSSDFSVLFAKYKRACITGYCIRCIYGLYLVLRSKNRPKSNTIISKLKQIFLTINHYQFASSIGLTTVTYTLITNFLNKKQSQPLSDIDEHNPLHTPINNKREIKIKLLAITIAMIWFKALPKEFREMTVLHLFARAIYDLIKLFKYDNEYKILPQIPHDEMYIGAAALTTIGYGIYHNPWTFDKGFYQFILKWGSNTHQQIGNVFRSKKDPLSPVRLRGEAFVECIPEWHSDPSCFRFHMKNIVRDFLRSNGMYAFVHLAPLLISMKFWRLCYDVMYSMFVKNDDDELDEDNRMKLFKLSFCILIFAITYVGAHYKQSILGLSFAFACLLIELWYFFMAFFIDTFLVIFTSWPVCIAVRSTVWQMPSAQPASSNLITSIDHDSNTNMNPPYVESISNKYNLASYLLGSSYTTNDSSKTFMPSYNKIKYIPSRNVLSNSVIIHKFTKNTIATVDGNNENKQNETFAAASSATVTQIKHGNIPIIGVDVSVNTSYTLAAAAECDVASDLKDIIVMKN